MDYQNRYRTVALLHVDARAPNNCLIFGRLFCFCVMKRMVKISARPTVGRAPLSLSLSDALAMKLKTQHHCCAVLYAHCCPLTRYCRSQRNVPGPVRHHLPTSVPSFSPAIPWVKCFYLRFTRTLSKKKHTPHRWKTKAAGASERFLVCQCVQVFRSVKYWGDEVTTAGCVCSD